MFIFNCKINKNLLFKIIFVILFVIVLMISLVGVVKIFKTRENSKCVSKSRINVISSFNYTDVLQTVHNNLSQYEGTKVKMVGYVYRLYDFENDKFVIARQMIISSDMQAVVVGFLCKLDGAENYKDGTWVQIEGTIKRGEYHGEIPMIEVEKIEETKIPTDEYVYPPKSTYIPNEQGL